MDNRGIARVKPSAAKRMRGRIRIPVVPLHDDIATDDDLADGLSVVRDLAAIFILDHQLTGRDQLDTLPRLDGRLLVG